MQQVQRAVGDDAHITIGTTLHDAVSHGAARRGGTVHVGDDARAVVETQVRIQTCARENLTRRDVVA